MSESASGDSVGVRIGPRIRISEGGEGWFDAALEIDGGRRVADESGPSFRDLARSMIGLAKLYRPNEIPLLSFVPAAARRPTAYCPRCGEPPPTRGHPHVAPIKEANAPKPRLNSATTSLIAELPTHGIDIEVHLAQLAGEAEVLSRLQRKKAPGIWGWVKRFFKSEAAHRPEDSPRRRGGTERR